MVAASTMMLIMSVASTAMAVVGAIQEGKAAKDTADYNAALSARSARLSENQATLVRQTAMSNEKIFDKEKRIRMGAIRAKGGPNLSLDAFASTMLDEELEQFSILTAGENTARAHLVAAENSRAQGALGLFKGEQAQSASLLAAGGAALGGASTYIGKAQKLPKGNPLRIS